MENSVGQQLKKAREALGVQLEDAAKATHIKLVYLQELESDHPELLPSPASARGFLRLYAAYLKLPTSPLIEQWDHPVPPEPAPAPVTGIFKVEEKSAEPAAEPVTTLAPDASLIPVKEPEPTEFPSPLAELQSVPVPEKKKRGRRKKVESVVEKALAEGSKPEMPSESVVKGEPGAGSSPEPEETAPIPQSDTATASPSPQKSSVELFIEIGSQLRGRRELLGLSLADIERFTHIKRPFLEALENGQFSQLPSSVQGRGMLNNYASFLSLDEGVLMGTYASALEAQRLERLPPRKPEPLVTGGIRFNIPERFKKYLNPDLVFGSLVILAMFVFLLWSAVQVFTGQNPKGTPTAPSISEVLQVTPTALPAAELTLTAQVTASPAGTTAPVSGLPAAPSAPTAVATKNTAPIQVYLIALQRAYLQVSVDGKVVFDGRVAPGGAYTYSGQKSVVLLTGSAAALEVYFNQKFQGKLGEIGQVVKLSFDEKGLIAPVATLTPLATASVTPTITVTPTAKK